MIDYKNIVKSWLETNADQYITLKKDGRNQVVSFKKTMVSDLVKHLEIYEEKEAERVKGLVNFMEAEIESDIIRRVKQVIGCKLNIDREIRLKDNLASDFGMDSLDELEVIMGLEMEFKIQLSDEWLLDWMKKNRDIKTVSDVVDVVSDKISGK